MDTLFPEVKEVVSEATQEERDEIAAQLISIWENPPEVLLHWEKNGRIVKPNTSGAVEMKTNTAHHSKRWRIREALNRTSLTAERKEALGKIKHQLHSVDDNLFTERNDIVRQITVKMNDKIPPGDKSELDSSITANIIPVSMFTQKYMDSSVGKVGSTFTEFKEKYESVIEIAEIIE